MIKIVDKRGTGKTSRLLLLAKKYDATVVTHDPRYAIELGYEYGITGLKVMSYNEFLNSRGSSDKYIIDDLSGFLLQLPGNIIGYSESIED